MKRSPQHQTPRNQSLMAWFKQNSFNVGSVFFGLCLIYYLLSGTEHITRIGSSIRGSSYLEIGSWNIAAINNNPFEYWVTMENEEYNHIMEQVQEFIDNPGAKDVPVSNIISAEMFGELKAKLVEAGIPKKDVDAVNKMWENDFQHRKIVSEFLKDPVIGAKRLASMPDRVSNTMHTVNGDVYRPTVINCYDQPLDTMRQWWSSWVSFMFDFDVELKDGNKKVINMLSPIKKAKYPKITAAEEAVSIPLSTMAAAIFDGILVHMMNDIAPNSWQPIRTSICEALNLKKTEHTVGVITQTYGNLDIFFMQEVATTFIEQLRNTPEIAASFHVLAPAVLNKRNQNSIMMLRKSVFDATSVEEHTLTFPKGVPVAAGDVFAVTVNNKLNGKQYLLASFHGDTNGLGTIPVVEAMDKLAKSFPERPRLVFGLDANTYSKGKPGVTQDVMEFAELYTSLGLTSCWGDKPDPENYTTFNARTYLQPQLNKASSKAQLKEKGDINPKDFVLFYKSDFQVVVVNKDNTGKKMYTEDMVFPTLTFPSDHGVLSTILD